MGTLLCDLHKGPYPTASLAGGWADSSTTKAVMKPIFKLVEKIFALQFGFKGTLNS
jgi:hypothetical protein